MKLRKKVSEIVQLFRNEDGTMDVVFDEASKARSVTFTTDYGAVIKFKKPRQTYQMSDRVVGISIRG